MKKSAFTLAEVLITLTIIGVIAALTIPNLMQKWQDHADVARVKEAYTLIDNALKIMMKTEGYNDLTELDWENDGWISYSEHPLIDLKPYLKIQKYCTRAESNICYDYTKIKTLNGAQGWGISSHPKGNYAILSNGMLLYIDGVSNNPLVDKANNSVSGTIGIDINGKKGPNRYGYDIFFLVFDKNGLNTKTNTFYNTYYCKDTNACTITNSHNTGTKDGTACAYWVIKHGNMDYKYRDVSAEW